MMKKEALFILILAVLLAACVNAGTSQPTPAATEVPTLTIEERPLLAQESVEDVLLGYEDEPWIDFAGVQSQLTIGEDVYSYFMEEEPVEEGVGDQAPNLPYLIVMKNDQRVMSIPLGRGSTIHPIWAFVASEGDWYIEVFRDPGVIDENGQELPGGGDIFRSGESLNTLYGYDESFGFHLVSGLPFYFYVRDGAFGYVYNGVETPLDYSDIRHYGCCSAGQANPRGSEDRVVIFTTRGDQRFLVMIGDFEE